MGPLEGIHYDNVNLEGGGVTSELSLSTGMTYLGSIERSIPGIQLPWVTKLHQRLLQLLGEEETSSHPPHPHTLTPSHLLRLVPECGVPHELLGPCGEVELEGEAKHAIDVPQEIQTAFDLARDLHTYNRTSFKASAQTRNLSPPPLPSLPPPPLTWSGVQKMCASSCWKRRTRVRPDRAPEISLRCRTPKSAILRGSSLHERGRCENMRQWPGQFIGFRANSSFSTSNWNMCSCAVVQ